MLIPLLRRFLAPYRRLLVAVIVLSLVGSMASLFLPSLNAAIIDNGVAQGDTGYIWRTGGVMLVVSLLQVVCTIAGTYFGARVAMSFGRDVRGAIFGRVLAFSAREVNHFGAPSLITRNTNDVQQVQMLVLLSATMLLSAPITMIGGIIMALREDVGLSWLVAVAMPVLAGSIFLVVRQMRPLFRVMQDRIDTVNRVLREQITGIRVVRAFVREPYETTRFAKANGELTDVATTVGRLQASLFPIVMLILNISSVAVLWFGAQRIAAGQMQIGSLTAFLTYLIQILFSVMMATFLLMIAPRAAVSADRIGEVLETDSSVVLPTEPVTDLPLTSTVEFADTEFTYPGRRDAGAAQHQPDRPARADHGDHRLDRRRQVDADLADPPAVRRDRRRRRGRRGRRTRLRRRPAVEPDRPGAAEAVPVHRHGGQQPALRQPRRHRRGALARPAGRPGRGLRPRHAATSWRRRSPRAAPTSPAVSGSGSRSPGRWSSGPRSTSSTTRSPRSTWPPTPGCGRRSRPRPGTGA